MLGVDGTTNGWVGIVLADGRYETANAAETLDALVAEAGAMDVIAIDMVIGWVAGTRRADSLIRKQLPGRAPTVFNAPPAAVRGASSYEEGCTLAEEATGKKITKQTWYLVPKIEEATAFAASSSCRVVEAHPELSFATMRGDGPIPFSKKTWGGLVERRDLLAAEGIDLPDYIGAPARAAPDDVLDAAAVAWTAYRVATDRAEYLPDEPEEGIDGVQITVWH